MSEQQILQNLVQQNAGTHTQGQAAVPSAANTGNPNTVWNHTTYAVSPGQPTQFNLTSTPVTPSNPGYTPPFTADPYLAKAMSSIPQASGNEHVDRILNSLFSGGGQGGPTGGGGPGWGGGGGGGTGGGGTGGGGTGGGSWQRGGGEGISVGPISGPTWPGNKDFSWQGVYDNAMPNTSLTESGLGRDAALPWLSYNPTGGSAGSGSGISTPAWLANLGDKAVQAIKSGVGDTSSWQQFLDIISEPFLPGDWYNSRTGQWNNPMDAMGLGDLNNVDLDKVDPQSLITAFTKIREQGNAVYQDYMNRSGDKAADSILNPQKDWESWYNSQDQYSPSEWKQKQESMAWNNFWYGSGSRTTNPITGMMSDSNTGDFLNALAAEALELEKKMREMYTKMR